MKNKRAIRLLLLANFISGVAQGISMISIPIYFAKTGTSHWFNIAYVFITFVSLFWSLYSGVLVDKHNRKKIFVLLNLTNAFAIGTIAYLEWSTTGYTSYLAVGVFALTFWNFNLHYPCFHAFMQEITEKENYNKIASYVEVQSQMSSALAGAGAALLLSGGGSTPYFSFTVEPWTLAQIFALDSLTYFIAFLIIALIRFVPIAERKNEFGGVIDRLKIGYQSLKGQPYVFLFGIVSNAVFVVVLLHVFSLAPLYVTQCLNAASEVFAVSELFYALGAIVVGLIIHMLFARINYVKAIIIMTFVTIIEFVCLVGSTWVAVFFAVSFMLGITNAGIRVLRISYIFETIPNQVIGRTNSIFFLTNVLSRIVLLSLFSMAFFHHSGHVIYSFLTLTIFMLLSMVILMYFYSKIILKREPK